MSESAERSLVGATPRISLAILAMGGQGGGVLADWIVALAEARAGRAQSTSVPGVAQRTGATIYYIEMAPPRDGVDPVFALMPTPGDVDFVMAAELMEAGRSVLRGLVTPDRTTLIASTHRSLAVVEKQAPGDGVADPEVVVLATDFAARRVIAFDMEAMAKAKGSVISATMFGALAGVRAIALSARRVRRRDPRRRRGRRGEPRGFWRGLSSRPASSRSSRSAAGRKSVSSRWPDHAGNAELDRIGDAHQRLSRRRAADARCGRAKARRLSRSRLCDRISRPDRRAHASSIAPAAGKRKGFAFTVAAAKYLATAMAYDDVPRVADLKIRASRQARVRQEVQAAPDTIVTTTEYFHPRVDELCGSLPKALGEWIEARPGLVSFLRTYVDRGRRIRANTIAGYLMLAFVASRGPKRRGTLRHAREMEHIEAWLEVAQRALKARYELGVGVLGCRRLVKGYSDTHARGLSKFDRVMTAAPALMSREDGADWLDRLKRAALADEQGDALDGVLKTIATL